jgi:CheY-like chemotaxis protein
MMDKELKILLLEDSVEDISIIQREIKRGGIQCEFSVGDTRDEFELAMKEFKPDIILCDHSMPMFNSIEAIEIVNAFKEQEQRGIPLILVTGTVSEEFAAQCIQAGAVDYILKDRLRRLPDAIKKAIEKTRIENEHQRYLNKVIASERRMKEAERLAQFGSWKWNRITGECSLSDGVYRILGYESDDETIAAPDLLLSHIHDDDRKYLEEHFQNLWNETSVAQIEFRIVTKQGDIKYIFGRLVSEIGGSGDSDKITGFYLDISGRRVAENLLKKAQEMARLGGWELDLASQKLTWTDITKQIHEVDQDYEPDLNRAINFYREGISRKTIEEAVNAAINDGKPWDVELETVTAKGNIRWVRAIGSAEWKQGQCVRIYGSIQDIHDRKLAELALNEKVEKLRKIAWTQSHEVRGPLARLKGLTSLLMLQDEGDRDDIIQKIMNATNELDDVIGRTVKLTYDD